MLTSVQFSRAPSGQAVLVCGLGRLGLQCVQSLAGYRVPVRAIDLKPASAFGTEIASLTTGDFRDLETLRKAGVAQCRSIILLSGDTDANIEGALAARRVNPEIRLVVRGEQHSWHTLLSERLGNLVVYEPNRLSASALAFAVLDAHVLAHFYVDDQLFQVTEHDVQAGEPWVGAAIESAQGPGRQILMHVPGEPTTVQRESEFYGWHPEQRIAVGDKLLVLTRGRPLQPRAAAAAQLPSRLESLRWMLHEFVQRQKREGLSRAAAVTLTGLGVMAALVVLALVFFSFSQPNWSIGEAFRLAMVLLTGGHLADVVEHYENLSSGVHWAELLLTMAGTLLTAIVYALLTDRLVTARFNLLARRPRPPGRGHIIIAGLGATGERIAGLLEQLERPAVAVESEPLSPHAPPQLPVIRGSATASLNLREANLDAAHGLVAATRDDLKNVQIALLAASLNPQCRLAVRIFDPRLSENAKILLPEAKILCVSSLAATAYAAAALGEHVVSLFQVLGRPVLVVEYVVGERDTLDRRALWEISEGYAVVPVLFQPAGGKSRAPLLDDAVVQLAVGDRLVVLASAASLEAIERGDMRPREYELQLEALRPYAEPLQVVGMLAQRFGYTLEHAREVLANLPHRIPERLYGLYARRTHRLLQANGLTTTLRRVTSQEPRIVVENLSRRPSREPGLDWTRSIGLAAQGREPSASSVAAKVTSHAKGLDPQK